LYAFSFTGRYECPILNIDDIIFIRGTTPRSSQFRNALIIEISIQFYKIYCLKIRGQYESRDSRVSLESWYSRSRSNPLETLARLSKFVILCKINKFYSEKRISFKNFEDYKIVRKYFTIYHYFSCLF
jgi:hypothetical protein